MDERYSEHRLIFGKDQVSIQFLNFIIKFNAFFNVIFCFYFKDENKEWFELLRHLTENAYNMNDNIAVTFIAHSMGGRMILYFLQQMSQSWKDQYVKQVITLSVPWGGSVQAIQAISVGYDFGAEIIQNIKMNDVQKTCPSVVWLMPSEHFWKPNEVLATMKKKNYTMQNIDEFFK